MLSEGQRKTFRFTKRAVDMAGVCIGLSKTMLSWSGCCSMSGKNHARPAPARADLLLPDRIVNRLITRRERAVAVCVTRHSKANLFEIVHTGSPPRLLARSLNSGQQQGDQDRDDRDHHQELDQREAGRT